MKIKHFRILTEIRSQAVITLPLPEDATQEQAMNMIFDMGHLPIRELSEDEIPSYDNYVKEIREELMIIRREKGGKNATSKKLQTTID